MHLPLTVRNRWREIALPEREYYRILQLGANPSATRSPKAAASRNPAPL